LKILIDDLKHLGAEALLQSNLGSDVGHLQTEDNFAERRRNRQFKQVDSLPKLDADSAKSWGHIEASQSEELEPTDIDILAWYQSYSDYGPNAWGIYFDTAKMNSYALKIHAFAKRIRPNIKPQLVQQVVWDEVMRHEIEHCVQELTGALLATLPLHKKKTALEIYHRDPRAFEALATHFQHTHAKYRPKGSAVSDFEFIKHITAWAPKPDGYKDWNRIDVAQAENAVYANGLSFDVTKIADHIRRQLQKPFSSNFLRIPIWLA